jgi:hypothetical protein
MIVTASTETRHRFIHAVQRHEPPGVAGIVAMIRAFAFMRASVDGRGAPLLQGALIVIAVLTGWWSLDYSARLELAAELYAFEARSLELTTRALAPGSALACLDAIAGDVVEDACERALFASPEAAAAAVSYVAAQLSLLASASDRARRPVSNLRSAQLRRALEADRFGIAAHVLAVRDSCTPDRCGPLALLDDASRINANLAERPFEAHVKRYGAGWPAAGRSPVGRNAPPISTADALGAAPKSPNNLYFPSSASIPPVNIMMAEPAASPPHDTTRAREAVAKPRKPTPGVSQTRQQAKP